MSMYRANGSLFDGESTETRPFKYRHELKYVINCGDYMGLRANLSAFAKKTETAARTEIIMSAACISTITTTRC